MLAVRLTELTTAPLSDSSGLFSVWISAQSLHIAPLNTTVVINVGIKTLIKAVSIRHHRNITSKNMFPVTAVILPPLLVFLVLNPTTTRGRRERSSALEDTEKSLTSVVFVLLPLSPEWYSCMQRNVSSPLCCLISACLVGLPVCSPPPALLFSIHYDTLKVHHVSYGGEWSSRGGGCAMFRYIRYTRTKQ